jgi:putative ABC transport system permease protein
MIVEEIRTAFSALWMNRKRSLLALVGIVVGVFAVTALVGLGQMASSAIQNELNAVAGRSIYVQPNVSELGNLVQLGKADLEILGSLPVFVIPRIITLCQYSDSKGQLKTLQLVGTPGDLPDLNPALHLRKGRYFSSIESQMGQSLAVVNERAALEVFGTKNPIGNKLLTYFRDGQRAILTVVGVTEESSTIFGASSSIISVPIPFLWQKDSEVRPETYTSVELRVKQGIPVDQTIAAVQRILEARHGKERFLILATENLQAALRTITTILQIFLGAVASLSLLVGGTGIMNIMYVSVIERRREIGLRKALGATPSIIRRQFLIEAMALTLTGGVLGVLLALTLLLIVSLAVPFLRIIGISPFVILTSLGLSILVGLVFGVRPAAKAAALQPIEALRSE